LLFAIGLYGVITARSMLVRIVGFAVMIDAPNLALVSVGAPGLAGISMVADAAIVASAIVLLRWRKEAVL